MAPVVAVNVPNYEAGGDRQLGHKPGTVGHPLPGVAVRIVDPVTRQPLAPNQEGLLLVKGSNRMIGYLGQPERTAGVFHEGWYVTGDIARIDDEGFLSITGRKKELLVLSNGKKVVPTHIEGLLLGDPCIDQAVVYGEGRNFLSALVVPHWDNLCRELRAAGVVKDQDDAEKLTSDAGVRDFLQKRVDAALKDVSSCEQIRKFIVLPRPFTVAADELTVSLKLRRNVVIGKHQQELERLYQD